MTKKKIFFDIESYPNYFLIIFKIDGKYKVIDIRDNETLNSDILDNLYKYLTYNKTLIGFNSSNYDMLMLGYFIKNNPTASDLNKLSNKIIKNQKLFAWEIANKLGINYLLKIIDSIDIIDLLPLKASLKMYGARANTSKIQDLPYDPNLQIDDDKKDVIIEYCKNDIKITEELYYKVEENIDLRIELSNSIFPKKDNKNVNLCSYSDAKIAEKYFSILFKLPYVKGGHLIDKKHLKYSIDPHVDFKTKELIELYKDIKNHEFTILNNGKIENIKREICVKDSPLSFGIGGLHSKESSISDESSILYVIEDIDVVSYYPNIILNNKLYPENIGDKFLPAYEKILKGKLDSKSKIEKSMYKIILNGTFGKFGSKYSNLYSPNLLLNTTLTGQFHLLKLMEMFLEKGIKVLSLNTDSITIKRPIKDIDQLDKCRVTTNILKKWTGIYNYSVTRTVLKSLHKHSVNSYVAVDNNNNIIAKGIYGESSLSNNSLPYAIRYAISEYILNKTLPEDTINKISNDDINHFTYIRKVTGGAYFMNKDVGSVVRWYISATGWPIYYKKSGNRVPGTEFGHECYSRIINNYEDYDHDAYPLYKKHYIDSTYDNLKLLGVDV